MAKMVIFVIFGTLGPNTRESRLLLDPKSVKNVKNGDFRQTHYENSQENQHFRKNHVFGQKPLMKPPGNVKKC